MSDMTDWRAAAALEAARSGDSDAFGALAEAHRRELLLHCYRLLGSIDAAEDVVQETLLRAWQHLDRFQGNRHFRAWLYKIATNACLDVLAKQPRPRTRAITGPTERRPAASTDILDETTQQLGQTDETQAHSSQSDDYLWLQPFPDALLPPSAASPEAHFLARESITLAFIALLHLLPPRQRAILILRDALDWSAREVAALLDSTVSSVESALHRARVTLSRHQLPSDDPPPVLDSSTRTLLDSYVQAWEREDIAALTQLLHADARLSMPPLSATYRGPAAITAFWASAMDHKRTPDRWRLLPTRANTQPAFAFYQREPGMPAHVAHGILVLRVTGGLIDELTMFLDPDLFPHFKLPAILPS